MLKLKRLELHGFKSFCDRTEVKFNGSGIIAVVGPNGCGKSNLSDAISWVLGEQSAKSLRGSRMEDVIFAGTRERKPVGMASVTMSLVDPEVRAEPAAQAAAGAGEPKRPGEIVITRRLFRSGDSEYLIDGRPARLRDIQDIFMGTGLGPECYAIIEQGRIGQILSSRPQDRRAVIEEAAGVTRFKSRRRLAEAKLEGAKQNLNRVFDILEEVSRQVNSLKRQASKARRYGELQQELTGELRRLLAGRYRLLERDAARTAEDLSLASGEARQAAASVASSDQEYSRLQAETFRREQELTESRRQLAELKLEAERTRGRLESQAQQIASIEQRLSRGENETQELESRSAALQSELAAQSDRVLALEREVESARARFAAGAAGRESLNQRLREREKQIEASRQAVLRLLGEASALRNQLAQISEYLASVDREKTRLQKEEQTALADQEWIAASQEDLSRRLAERQLELESVSGRRRRAEENLADRRSRAAATRQRLDELRAEFSDIKARRDSLEEILSHRAYTTEAVKRLFTAAERGESGGLKPAGVLADFVEVDPAHEKAAEEFLHDELEYVLVNDWAQAEAGVTLLRTDLEGRATFLVHPDKHVSFGGPHADEPPIGPETGIVARLSDVLRLTNGLTDAPAELLPRLARCFLAENRADARRLAVQYPSYYFLAPDGVCYSGYAVSGGKKTGSGPLALKRELRDLAGSVRSRREEIDRTAALLESLDGEIARFEQELESLRAEQQGKEKETVALEHEARKLAEDKARAGSRLSMARLELGRLSQEQERALAQRASAEQGILEKEKARAGEEAALASVREEVEQLQAEAARAGEENAALRAGLAGLEERSRAGQESRARLEAQAREIEQRRLELGGETEGLGAERARLLGDNVELDRRALELAARIAESEAGVERQATGETAMREGLAALEESLRALRAGLQEAEQKRAGIELELVKRQAELRFLDETSHRELNTAIVEVAAPYEAVPDELELAETQQKYEDLKSRIEALGPVNAQALEEYQEAQQRYDFLNAQRQDLLDSIRDTEKAIQEIDVETRRRFSEAFEAINCHFREMFRTLFGGGTGEMRLTDEANAAESGIEIVASPPGKRLQNVLLLSGGEKALTALALLMGIFKYQPSPFCIFDEVDAPLDEPNIQRLTRLLKEMSAHTQFILITHAKRTMEAAEALYGVTMQEPGVSRLVSVHLKQNGAAAPPPPPEPLAAPALPA
ncbi:MAG: chromosome segregation protein SMC [Bryobacterales bacterium]|nr:chromosome segregation protein SMC [Bryobacterales bacterium]